MTSYEFSERVVVAADIARQQVGIGGVHGAHAFTATSAIPALKPPVTAGSDVM